MGDLRGPRDLARAPRALLGKPTVLVPGRFAWWVFSQVRGRGAPGRIRTCDPRIRSPTLYPLSYGRSVW